MIIEDAEFSFPETRTALPERRIERKTSKPRTEQQSRAEKLLNDLYLKASEGDIRAAEAWFELTEKSAPPQSFDLDVRVVPYDIQDKSLGRIVAQADTPVVLELLNGLKMRLEVDEGPEELVGLVNCVALQYEAWAKVKYQPKDEVS